MTYRDFKTFDQEISSQELCTSLSSETVHDYNSFEENFLGVLNKHTPLKKKILLANHAPYITKKPTTKRLHLEKLSFLKKATESLNKYKKQAFL